MLWVMCCFESGAGRIHLPEFCQWLDSGTITSYLTWKIKYCFKDVRINSKLYEVLVLFDKKES